MKLRFFHDDHIKFKVVGREDLADITGESLKEVKTKLFSRIHGSDSVLVEMVQDSSERSSKPDNILHFCESAKFIMSGKKLELMTALFKFRTTIDQTTGYGRWYYNSFIGLEYYNNTYGDRIASKYFKKRCKDRELAEFLLAMKELITY